MNNTVANSIKRASSTACYMREHNLTLTGIDVTLLGQDRGMLGVGFGSALNHVKQVGSFKALGLFFFPAFWVIFPACKGAPWCLAICPECADSNAKTWCDSFATRCL